MRKFYKESDFLLEMIKMFEVFGLDCEACTKVIACSKI